MFDALDDRVVSIIVAALPFDACLLLLDPVSKQLHRPAGDAVVRHLVRCPEWVLGRLCEALCRRAAPERVFLSLLAADFPAARWQILLCNAAARGLTGAVVCAISRGVVADALLHVAVRHGHCALAAALLGRGADPNAPRPDSGSTPLHEAALHRTPSPVVQLLLDSKSDANCATERGNNTPLHMAAVCGHTNGLAALIAAGADLTAQNSFGGTPLHVAVYNGNLRNCGALLAAGADRGATDNHGKTPLDRAIQYGHAAIVDLLRAAGGAAPARG